MSLSALLQNTVQCHRCSAAVSPHNGSQSLQEWERGLGDVWRMFDECLTNVLQPLIAMWLLCCSAQCCKLWRKPSPAAGGYCEYCSSLQLTLDDRHNVHIPARHFSNPRNLFLPSCRALPLVCVWRVLRPTRGHGHAPGHVWARGAWHMTHWGRVSPETVNKGGGVVRGVDFHAGIKWSSQNH